MLVKNLVLYNKSLLRGFPCLITVASILAFLLFQIKIGIYYALVNIIANFLSYFLKEFFRYLYEIIFKKESLFILGPGKRPKGALNCGCFIDEDNPKKIAKSFGMPSGHGLSAMLFCTFWSLYIIDNYPNNFRRHLSIIILNFICFLVLISRLYLGCHTIQQVLVGSILGLIFGYISYKLYNKSFS